MDESQMQKLLMQLEYGKRQMNELNRQAQLAESAVAEINSAIEALDELKSQKPGAEVLVPVGGGAFVKASLKDMGTVLVGVGAEMYVEKGIAEAVKTFEERKVKLVESLSTIQKTMGELGMRVAELDAQAQRIMSQAKE